MDPTANQLTEPNEELPSYYALNGTTTGKKADQSKKEYPLQTQPGYSR
eukprot:CAMPEP_0172436214 /NCGR_PEP_ID=MMETSP1064-20121228/71607_1 /TAXON_ID=202472 /ORGANISM="Aulacoseira subarctica , Strain CCAP 1002/5" /LENGTH=47 /DNA_ID= /DNA_START= /DNA_END= /DNA_ORIENTATION=